MFQARHKIALWVSLIPLTLIMVLSPRVQAAETGNLVISIQNLRNLNQGKLNVILYRKVEPVDLDMRKAFMLQRAPVRQDRLTVTFEELSYGDYAIAVFHDMNGDGRMNTNLFGLPSEDIAISNNAKVSFFSNPAWNQAKISLNSDKLVITPLIMDHKYSMAESVATTEADRSERGQ